MRFALRLTYNLEHGFGVSLLPSYRGSNSRGNALHSFFAYTRDQNQPSETSALILFSHLSLPYSCSDNPFTMEDILSKMWNSLPLSKTEAITIKIDDSSLSNPGFALVGKLAMKKFINIAEVDR